MVDGPAVSTADGQRVVDGQSDLPFGFAAGATDSDAGSIG